MATKDEVLVHDWNGNGKPDMLNFTVEGKPQSLMVTPVHIGQMQVEQMQVEMQVEQMQVGQMKVDRCKLDRCVHFEWHMRVRLIVRRRTAFHFR